MTEHEVDVGARVRSRDGKQLGEIEQLMYLPETRQVGGFLLGKGILSAPKIIETELIERTGSEGVTLSLTAAEVEQLPAYVRKQLVRPAGDVAIPDPSGAPVDVARGNGPWAMRGVEGLPNVGASSLFLYAPIGEIETMNVSNLPENVVLVGEGTDVVGADGKKIGQVDEVFVDDGHRVTGLLVKAGWLFRHHVTIPADAIAAITHEEVRLRMPAAAAEHSSWEPADG